MSVQAHSASAAALEDCDQSADIARTVEGCSALILAPDISTRMRAWAYSRRATNIRDAERAMSDIDASIALDPTRAFPFAVRARFWRTRRDFDRAIADYSEASRLDPKDPNVFNNRANIWSIKNDPAKALADYTEALRLKPDFAEAMAGRARLHLRQRRYDEAIADFDSALRLRSRDAWALIGRGEAFEMKGDQEKALADYEEALRIDPQYASAYNSRANIWWRRGDPDRALADIDRAIALDPKDTTFYVTRATALYEKGLKPEAIAAYDEAIKLNPRMAAAYNNRGFIWRDLHQLNRAIVDFDEAIRLDPAYGKAWANRGEIWRLRGDLDRAIADEDQAIKVSPDDAYGYVARANSLRYKGEIAKALADYDKALAVGQYDLSAWVGKGLTFEKAGDISAARREFQRAVTSNVPFRSDINRQSLETARARLAAFDSGAVQPRIPAAPSKAASATSIPTPAVAAPSLVTAKSQKERRVALVIGNARYQAANLLPNPVNDATVIAKSLRAIGFETVSVTTDATRSQMLDALKRFSRLAAQSDWAVVYYGGHGIESNGTNYLIPVDARIEDDTDFEKAAVPLDEVMTAVESARKLKLVLLDACRNNPFATRDRPIATPNVATASRKTLLASNGQTSDVGLAEVKVSGAMLVVYAAKHGQQALDGDGDDSPFTVALVQRIATPNVEINKLFRLVRDDVMEATAGRQEPFTYGSLPGREDFYFVSR